MLPNACRKQRAIELTLGLPCQAVGTSGHLPYVLIDHPPHRRVFPHHGLVHEAHLAAQNAEHAVEMHPILR